MDFVVTADGSVSLKDKATGELYHNKAGAYTEALENYVKPSGILHRLSSTGQIRLIDACFGMGYNSLAMLAEATNGKLKGRIEIIAIDNDAKIKHALPAVLQFPKFSQLVQAFRLNSTFKTGDLEISIHLEERSLPEVLIELSSPRAANFDFVFHDPFSPKRVPELWTVDIFRLYFKLLKADGGALLTYSAASAVRGGLKEAGFQVARTTAVGAKDGGTLAVKSDRQIDEMNQAFQTIPFRADELQKMASDSSTPYRDPNLALNRAEILANRQGEISEKRVAKQGLSAT